MSTTGTAVDQAPALGAGSDAWVLYEVFVRARRGLSHTHVGSIHGPDSEMALRNARDLYTRRQEGVSLWVIPSRTITAWSPDESDSSANPATDNVYRHPSFDKATTADEETAPGTGAERASLFEVFVRSRRGLAHTHVGSLQAPDAETALRNARALYARRQQGVSVWVVSSTTITASLPGDKDSFFSPASDKLYRYPTFYDVPEGVQM